MAESPQNGNRHMGRRNGLPLPLAGEGWGGGLQPLHKRPRLWPAAPLSLSSERREPSCVATIYHNGCVAPCGVTRMSAPPSDGALVAN